MFCFFFSLSRASGDNLRRDMENFVLAFDTTLAPIVGQQVTLDATNAAVAGPRIDLMIARAAAASALRTDYRRDASSAHAVASSARQRGDGRVGERGEVGLEGSGRRRRGPTA